jgi:hypothetical protein
VALYNVFRESRSTFEYEAVKLRSRYRLVEPGSSFVDVVLYVEAEQAFVDQRETALEEKLILGKDIGRTNLALNLVAEQELEDGAFEPQFGYALGASYEVHPRVRIGAESFGEIKEHYGPNGEESMQLDAWAGPSLSIALPAHLGGAVHGAFMTFSAGVGLTSSADDLQARAILAFQF